jgi:transglutaminase-like putative cysteine protease
MSVSRLALPTALPPVRASDARATNAAVRSARRWAPTATAIGLGIAGTVLVLAVVPIPEGPARLTLPTFIEDVREVGSPGSIVSPDGDVRDSGDGGDGSRAPAGQPGGYTGFAQSMDTSVRGELSDEIVMRVRAPQPDFWRGQTFDTFDGRRWFADDDVGNLHSGPNIDVPRALGDTADPDTIPVERFVQTYYVERDMPNVVFGAYRPVQAIVDADVWTRDDGAMRASTVLTEGSIYTIVSERPHVTEQRLRDQRLIGERLSRFGRQVLGRYLVVPESTSPETIALADRLAKGATSTYDVVRAYEQWLADNVEYDLHAPLPDDGEDAVHDFLFDSQRGFCEQIASALAIMLRTQGVPTRVATGYAAGVRDRIAGVFEVRASDAHAWVEVWFPETGWQAFDPTASVPLSGEAEVSTVGSELATGLIDYLDRHTPEVMVAVLSLAVMLTALLLGRELRRRRRRGRWGLLQDRFGAMAATLGAPAGTTNARRATRWTAADDAEVARLIAAQLDRVAFDPSFDDDDDEFVRTRKLVGSLRSSRR